MINDNILLLSDSYKVTHANQYPPGTTNVYSYFESRGGEFQEIVFFGLQYLLKRYLEGAVVTKEMVEEAREMFAKHLGSPDLFNRKGWMHIVEKHEGRLPVRIKAVPEGTVIAPRNVLMTIENTDPECWWLTNYLETLLVQVWYPTTVATVSREMKKTIRKGLQRSGDSSDASLAFKLHDFGCRGSTSMESAALGGAAHLVNFQGTDTIPALQLLRKYYSADVAGFSIPAAEHSTITSWGRDGERDAYRNMLKQFPKGPVAVVSDSWDIYHATRKIWGRELRSEVLEREGFVVIRPDSGDPRRVVPDLLKILDDEFGGVMNEKGFRLLHPNVRVIQGDGINRRMLGEIIDAVLEKGYSIDNLAFGCGGGLLQDCDRDTSQFAFKCSSVVIDGKQRDVFKQPATMASKNSKKGRLTLLKSHRYKIPMNGSEYMTVSEDSVESTRGEFDELQEVFEDGKVLVEEGLDVIRKRAEVR